MSCDAITLGPYFAGEIPEPVTHTFDKSDGTPEPLIPGSWTAKLEFRRWNTTTVTEKSATVLDQTASPGQVSWTWGNTDVATAGDFEGELWVGNGSNARYRSQRFRWLVRPSIQVAMV